VETKAKVDQPDAPERSARPADDRHADDHSIDKREFRERQVEKYLRKVSK
jgi:hypothetical protein